MFAAALVLLQTVGVSPTVWRNYEEVFDLAVVDGRVTAATNGGLVQLGAGGWVSLPSPSGLRSIERVQPLTVGAAGGGVFTFAASGWAAGGDAGRGRDLDSGVLVEPGATQPSGLSGHVYCLLRFGGDLYAGTAAGLYLRTGGKWSRQSLPSQMPVSRPNGVAEVDGTYVVGGIDGLFVGRPGAWKEVCSDSIRQVARVGNDVWCVHGNGALDKLEVKRGLLVPDLMTGASRRPWTSCLALSGSSVLLGGLGGWSERGVVESERFPAELEKDVVTAVAGRVGARWIGTEKSGLFRFSAGKSYCWNPGNGLLDTWVTSLCHTPLGLVVGTMHSGLFIVNGDHIEPLVSPTQKVTQVGIWQGWFMVGGLDGAWLKRSYGWMPLETHGEETTSVGEIRGRPVVTTASGVYFF